MNYQREDSIMNYQNMPNLGKRSLWFLIAMLIFYGPYFARVLRNVGQSQFASEAVWKPIVAALVIIGIEMLYHFVAPPVGVQPEPKDERDLLIESKAYRNGYFAYGTGAFLVIGAVIAAGV